jgi:hypothetical protein
MTVGRKKIVIVGASLLLIAAGAGIGVALWPRETEPSINLPRTAEEGFRMAASGEFAKLPDYRQEAYRREVQRLVAALPEDQRQAMFTKYRGSDEFIKGLREIRFDPVRTAVQEYFAAPPEKRTAVVDKMIDQMERFRALGGLGKSGGQGSSGSPQATPQMRSFIRDRMESDIQQGNPQETARTMEFLKQFRQRRIDRGLPVP